MSHASARPETATDRLNQKVFVPSPESSACDTCAVAADIDRMSYFKPTALRNRKLHKHPHRDAASRREGGALVNSFLFSINIAGNVGPGGPTLVIITSRPASSMVLKGNGQSRKSSLSHGPGE